MSQSYNDTEGSNSSMIDRKCSNYRQQYYSILNLPKNATTLHIQRSYKQLSRIYHPDKLIIASASSSVNNTVDDEIAQEAFVLIKTAVDVLSDPIYRLVYDYGDIIAVTIVKRSQSVHHSKQATSNTSTSKMDTNNGRSSDQQQNSHDEDLYSTLQRAVNRNDDIAFATVLQAAIDEFYIQSDLHHSMAHEIELSCDIPCTMKTMNSIAKDSMSLNVVTRHPINPQLNVSLGTYTESKHTAETNIKSSIGFDYQPVQGTNINTNVSCQHRNTNILETTDVSISTSRKLLNGSVLVAAVHGNMKKRQSWNMSLIANRPILYESLFGSNPFASSKDVNENIASLTVKKLLVSWRMICDTSTGQLRNLMVSIRTIQYPIWSGRFSFISEYPIKLSWQGSECNTFHTSVSLGLSAPRLKVLRIFSLGDQCILKYGLKYDVTSFVTKGTLWTLLCTIQWGDLFTIRIPIGLVTISPIQMISSLLITEFVDQQVQQMSQNFDHHQQIRNEYSEQRRSDNSFSHIHPQPINDVITKIAQKKRLYEQNRGTNGLIISRATVYLHPNLCYNFDNTTYDVTDIIQFWVVQGQLRISMLDPRIYLNMMQSIFDETQFLKLLNTLSKKKTEQYMWIDDVLSFLGIKTLYNHWMQNRSTPDDIDDVFIHYSITIRYQYSATTYEMTFDSICTQTSTILLPNCNATELGPSIRVQ